MMTKRFPTFPLFLVVILAGMISNVSAVGGGWASAGGILRRISPPQFAERVFLIQRYGGVADGATDNTNAIRRAIEACHAAGGGRVLISGGTFVTGAIHLKSNVELHVAKGARLLFLTDPRHYPIVHTRWEGVECMNYSPLIYAYGQKNIAVTGEGTLDGGASFQNWWGWCNKARQPVKQGPARRRLFAQGRAGVPVAQRVFGQGSYLRPNFIQFYRCSGILIEGVTIVRSPMWEVHPVLSQNISVRNIRIVSHGPNNDGIDPESCRDVLIENAWIDTGDDCISIKSGRNEDGRRIGVRAENIVVRNCTMVDGHGGVVIGSEISGGARNVFVENCRMDSPHLDRAFRFKSNAQRGGVMENIFVRNVWIGRVSEAVLTIDFLYEEGSDGPVKPVVRNVQLENVTSASSPRVMWIDGFPGASIDRILFRNCVFQGVENAEVMSFAGNISFQNVKIQPTRKERSLNSPEGSPTAPVTGRR